MGIHTSMTRISSQLRLRLFRNYWHRTARHRPTLSRGTCKLRERSGIIRNAFCIRWTNDRTIHPSLSLTFNNNVSSLFITWRHGVFCARFAIVLTKPLHYTLFYPADWSLLRSFFSRQSLSLFSICRFFMLLPFYRFYYAFFHLVL